MLQQNIFIVEDSPIIAAALKQTVTKLGHKVVGIAESYDDAIFQLKNSCVDMVITDIMLNGQKNGIDLANYINKYLNIPVIYHSSVTEASIIINAMRTSPVAYLVKPASRNELSTALLSVEAA